MHESGSHGSYRVYWVTWAILLAITGFMLAVEYLSLSKALLVGVLLGAMLLKAALIGGEFMHLRSENSLLIWSVVGTILFFSTFLFVLIWFDAQRIAKMVQP